MDLYHYLQIVLLGIVEGVTEFLPISSTGHLLIAEHFLGTQEPDIFNVVIQAGAILAVVFIYWGKLTELLGNLDKPAERNYLIKIGISFVVTSVAYLVIAKLIGHHKLTESLGNVAWATLIGGFVIFGVEFFAKNLYAHDGVSWFESVLVGLAQVVAAIFPGASRSGSTIMAGLAVGMKRPEVTQFSFLVGIPTMFAASAFATFKSYKAGELKGIESQLLIDTAIGFVVSGIVAFFVVKWLLRFVQSHTFNGFAIYRVILGGGLLIGLYTHAIPDVTNEEAPKEDAALVQPASANATSEPAKPTPTPLVPAVPPATPAAPQQEYATNATTGQVAPIPTMNPASPSTMLPASAHDTTLAPPASTNSAP